MNSKTVLMFSGVAAERYTLWQSYNKAPAMDNPRDADFPRPLPALINFTSNLFPS